MYVEYFPSKYADDWLSLLKSAIIATLINQFVHFAFFTYSFIPYMLPRL